MTEKELSNLRKELGKLAEEAREAFVTKFPYLEITDLRSIHANVVRYDVAETDGSLLVELSCNVVRNFSTIKKFISDNNVLFFNYGIKDVYNEQVSFSISRLFYHTKKKFIFSM